MAQTKTVRRAKVVLTGAKSYKLAGQTFIKGVSTIVKGNAVDEFLKNGYFTAREISSVEKEVKKKKKKSSDDSGKKKLKRKTPKRKLPRNLQRK